MLPTHLFGVIAAAGLNVELTPAPTLVFMPQTNTNDTAFYSVSGNTCTVSNGVWTPEPDGYEVEIETSTLGTWSLYYSGNSTMVSGSPMTLFRGKVRAYKTYGGINVYGAVAYSPSLIIGEAPFINSGSAWITYDAPYVGLSLTIHHDLSIGGIPSPAIGFQWQRVGEGWMDILGENGPTYLLAALDVGASVRCLLTVSNMLGANSSVYAVTEGSIEAVVTGFSASAGAGGGEVVFSWTGGSSNIELYQSDNAGITYTFTGTFSGTSLTLGGFSTGTSYYFRAKFVGQTDYGFCSPVTAYAGEGSGGGEGPISLNPPTGVSLSNSGMILINGTADGSVPYGFSWSLYAEGVGLLATGNTGTFTIDTGVSSAGLEGLVLTVVVYNTGDGGTSYNNSSSVEAYLTI